MTTAQGTFPQKAMRKHIHSQVHPCQFLIFSVIRSDTACDCGNEAQADNGAAALLSPSTSPQAKQGITG